MKIRSFVGQLLEEHDDRAPFGDDESLMTAGRLDSFAVVKLVMFLEEAFGVDFARVEFDPQRFDTIREIAGIVQESRRLA